MEALSHIPFAASEADVSQGKAASLKFTVMIAPARQCGDAVRADPAAGFAHTFEEELAALLNPFAAFEELRLPWPASHGTVSADRCRVFLCHRCPVRSAAHSLARSLAHDRALATLVLYESRVRVP